MSTTYVNSITNSGVRKVRSSGGPPKHVTFSEPEVSHVLITREESTPIMDRNTSPIASVEKPLIIRRYYFAEPEIIEQLRGNAKMCYCLDTRESWSELYYDTPTNSLCNLECILMKDTKAPKYWKFFSFAEDNIMEITTDEKEINEPLHRLVDGTQNGTNNHHRRLIDPDKLGTFFTISYEMDSFLALDNGTFLKVTCTDYGFAYIIMERICVNGELLADSTMEMDTLAKKLGFTSLACYNPSRYL